MVRIRCEGEENRYAILQWSILMLCKLFHILIGEIRMSVVLEYIDINTNISICIDARIVDMRDMSCITYTM